MALNKDLARRLKNERANTNRRIKNIEKILSGNYSAIRKQQARKDLAKLERSKGLTYVKTQTGKRSEAQLERNLAFLKRTNISTTKTATFGNNRFMSNEAFKKQLKFSQSKKTQILSSISKQDTDEFYGAFKNVWAGKSLAERDQAIMDYLKTDSLHEAFEMFEKMRSEALKIKQKKAEGKSLTEEEQKFVDEFMADIDGAPVDTSPPFVISIVDVIFRNA